MWKVISYVLTGSSHIENMILCQDYTTFASNSDSCAIVLADGAGSASYSLEGARAVSNMCARWLIDHFDGAFTENEKVLKKKLKLKITTELIKVSRKLGVDREQLSSTLLFVAIKNDQYITCHIGDGVIGVSINGVEEVLSNPERGEFANNTYFTTSLGIEHIRIQRGALGGISSFYLMSDGSADCLYYTYDNSFAPAVGKLSASLAADKTADSAFSNKLLADVMEQHFRSHTTDDCSFIMVQWDN